MHVLLDYALSKAGPSAKYWMNEFIEWSANVILILPQVASMDNNSVSLDNRFSYLDRWSLAFWHTHFWYERREFFWKVTSTKCIPATRHPILVKSRKRIKWNLFKRNVSLPWASTYFDFGLVLLGHRAIAGRCVHQCLWTDIVERSNLWILNNTGGIDGHFTRNTKIDQFQTASNH